MKIYLDPGHGGKDPGAIGKNGLHEARVTLAVCKALERILTAEEHNVRMSRTEDATVALEARARDCNAWGADAFISIHCNAAANREARGYEVWTTPGKTAADELAECVLVSLGHQLHGEPARLDKSDGDGDREAKFVVLHATNCPAILVEAGFISHAQTEMAMRSDAWVESVAQGIAQGVEMWLL